MKYSIRYACNPKDIKHYDTNRLRENFLIETLFEPNEINLVYSEYDRFIVGGIYPVDKVLNLETIEPLKSAYFLERREIGIINIGGKAQIKVDNTIFEINTNEALYIGRGVKQVLFESIDTTPAKLYVNSAPAHTAYPTKKIGIQEAERVEMGSLETANARVINKLMVNSLVQTCQVQMGLTELKSGSVWNTMPCHTHTRRMEAYFYFGIPDNQSACHFMGEPQETRHLWLQNEQAVISPNWSIHCGVATSSYSFIWGMAGENLDYGDMDHIKPNELR